jgi:hypothetical protein
VDLGRVEDALGRVSFLGDSLSAADVEHQKAGALTKRQQRFDRR